MINWAECCWIKPGEVYSLEKSNAPNASMKVLRPTSGCQGLRAELLPTQPGYQLVLVTYYIGYGWLSDDELFDLRQTEPRTAP